MFGVARRLGLVTSAVRPIKLESAVNLYGYMTYEELKWLAEQAQKHSKIVEIGTYLGKSTRALADNTDGFVVTVDNFAGPQDTTIPNALRNNIFELFMSFCYDLLQVGKLRVIADDHANVVLDFSPDMVFLDGSHIYEDIKRDISYWLPRITKGGLICGHDYTNMEDVRKAVSEIVPKAKVAKGTSIWYLTL